MITTIVYGIRLTDEFGEFIKQLSNDEIQLVKSCLNKKIIGFVDFPSEEEPQFFLGFETWISKNTDLRNFENIWTNVMMKAPKELNVLADKLKVNGCDTDVHFLASESLYKN
jgi:hypothetical protein